MDVAVDLTVREHLDRSAGAVDMAERPHRSVNARDMLSVIGLAR